MKVSHELHDRTLGSVAVILMLVTLVLVVASDVPSTLPPLTGGATVRALSRVLDSSTNGAHDTTLLHNGARAITTEGGVGGASIAVDPTTGYAYVINVNDTVSVIAGSKVVGTIDLPTGGFSRLTDIDILTTTGQVYVSHWWYDQVHVLSGTEQIATIPRDTDAPSGVSDGIENGPLIVAANPVNGYVYVATSWDGQTAKNGVSIIRNTEFVTHTVTGINPQAIAVDTDSGLVYVANGGSNTVTVIRDLETVADAIPVGTFPRALAVHPTTGDVYVVNRDSDDVTVIRGTDVAVSRILVGDSPQALYIAPSTGYVYVVNRVSDSVSVIDGTEVIDTISVGSNPLAIEGDAGEGYVYVANQLDGTISVLSGTELLTDITVGLSPVALAFNPTTELLYVVNHHSATVSLIQGQALIGTVSDLPQFSPVHFGVNPQTGELYATDLAAKRVSVYRSREVDAVASTVDSVPLLYENPARVDYYDYTKVP
ncbi:MAG: beta-propeller fold lactonase family protein, partial [Chloroflexi bacterium]|nr:beta-propeller fold lactonase family protein [Chloroflexota bacterium]